MATLQIVILLSVGTFQATLDTPPTEMSPVFEDSARGVEGFVAWLKPQLPPPHWGQAPLRFCVVGAVPFADKSAPYASKPLYLSEEPFHSLEPYSAVFHYIEDKGQLRIKKSRTMGDALAICSKAAAPQK